MCGIRSNVILLIIDDPVLSIIRLQYIRITGAVTFVPPSRCERAFAKSGVEIGCSCSRMISIIIAVLSLWKYSVIRILYHFNVNKLVNYIFKWRFFENGEDNTCIVSSAVGQIARLQSKLLFL